VFDFRKEGSIAYFGAVSANAKGVYVEKLCLALKRHKRIGWELLGIRGPMDGYTTQELETELLRMLRSKGAKLSPKEVAGKFDGYSEAWLQSTYPIQSIQELMEDLREYELVVSNRKNRSNDGKLKK
jgi:hypothetical protein